MFDVVTIGAATRDIFITSPLFKIVRDPAHLEKLGFPTGEAQCFALGGKIEVEKPSLTVGGGAANAAVTFARQGFSTAAVFKIGDDESGEAVLSTMKRERIKAFAPRDESRGTAYSTILLSPGGERTILNYRGASSFLSPRDISAVALNARAAYISPGHLDPVVLKKVFSVLRRNRAFIAINPSKFYIGLGLRRLLPIIRGADVVIMNREEASYLTGRSYRDEKSIFKKFDAAISCLAVMTEGPKGVLISDGKHVYRAGIFEEKRALDRTGAGDAFGSGFTAGLLRKMPRARKTESVFDIRTIDYAIRLGSANATGVVEAIGAQEGILTRRTFDGSPRFRKLHITTRAL